MYGELIGHLVRNCCPTDIVLQKLYLHCNEDGHTKEKCIECWEHAIKNIEGED